jgi:hypothetical protein
VKIGFDEDFEVIGDGFDHQFIERYFELPGLVITVRSVHDGPFIDADTNGYSGVFGCVDNFPHSLSFGDIARIEADFMHTGSNGFEGALEPEMHVGDYR